MLYIIFEGLKLTIKIQQSANDNDKSSHKVLRVPGSFFMVKPAGFFNTPLDIEQNKEIREHLAKHGERTSGISIMTGATDVEGRYQRFINPDKLLTVKELAKNLAGVDDLLELVDGKVKSLREYPSYKTLNENCPAESTICGFATKIHSSDLLYISSNRAELEEMVNRSKSLENESVYAYKRWEWSHTRRPQDFIEFLLGFIGANEELNLLDNNGYPLGYTVYDDKVEADMASHNILMLSVYEEAETKPEVEVDFFEEAAQRAYRACVLNNYDNFKKACSSMPDNIRELLIAVNTKINALKLPNKKLSANFAAFSTRFADETVTSELTAKPSLSL